MDLYELSNAAENVLKNINDIELINEIVTHIEIAINNGDEETETFPITLSPYNITCFVSYNKENFVIVLEKFLKTAIELEEYEVCTKIQNMLNDYKSFFSE